MKLPADIERAVRGFQRLQGVGRKTAERYIFDIVSHWKKEAIQELSQSILAIGELSAHCHSCRIPLQKEVTCPYCTEERRSSKVIAIVSSIRDLYSLEALQIFHGTYFLLHTLLSPVDRRGISIDTLEPLYNRINKEGIKEIFLAVDSSPEGEATSFYLTKSLKEQKIFDGIKITGFATGVPVGSTLDYLDMSTLGKAFLNRVSL
ncbi:MAG: toprim domain-containing protein [Chlamydia sp.]